MEARLKQDLPPTVEEILQEWVDGGSYGKDSHFIRGFSKVALNQIAALREEIATLRADATKAAEEVATLKRKLALIFDQSCYSDSLGVEGSSFLVCRWCGGGSGPGGKPAFSHNKGCLLDNDELEKEVAGVWEEVPELEKELSTLQTDLARERERHQWIEIKEGCEMPPNDEECIIAFYNNQSGPYSSAARWRDDQWWEENSDSIDYNHLTITHWRYLPEPPALLEPAPVATGEEK